MSHTVINVVLLSVHKLSVVYADCRVSYCYAECTNAKCRHSDCDGTKNYEPTWRRKETFKVYVGIHRNT